MNSASPMLNIRWTCAVLMGAALLAVSCTMPVQPPPPPILTAIPPQVGWASPPPTPYNPFGGYPPGALITLRQVGNIPADTPVQITSSSYDPAHGYTYDITNLNGLLSATATGRDLVIAPGYVPSQPTPAPLYDEPGYWSECYPLVTTEGLPLQGGSAGPNALLPPGTRVRVSAMPGSAAYLGNGRWTWFYTVSSADQPYAMLAREDQLAPAPGIDPSDMAGPTAALPYPLGGGFDFVTRGDAGAIPAGTPVRLSQAHMGCGQWQVTIVTGDGRSAEVSMSQVEPAPGVDPFAPTPANATPLPTLEPLP